MGTNLENPSLNIPGYNQYTKPRRNDISTKPSIVGWVNTEKFMKNIWTHSRAKAPHKNSLFCQFLQVKLWMSFTARNQPTFRANWEVKCRSYTFTDDDGWGVLYLFLFRPYCLSLPLVARGTQSFCTDEAGP